MNPLRVPSVLVAAFTLVATVSQINATNVKPKSAAEQLQGLKEHRGGSELSFKQVSEMARRLNDEPLVKLAKEVGVGRTDGMRGWVRAAVFAEWGNRDFDAAMTRLSGVAHLDSGHQQALYAVFRGSRPAEPVKALFHLRRMFEDYPSAVGAFTRMWAKRALQEVFADMAAQQPDRAWQMLTSEFENGRERMALEYLSQKFSRHPLRNIDSEWIALGGFFSGLKDLEGVKAYAALFEKEWNSPEVMVALKQYHAQYKRFTGGMNWTPPPPHEGVARAVAVSMARFDLSTGIDWIIKNGPGTEREKKGRAGSVFMDWAWENPQAAWAVLKRGDHVNWHVKITTALLRGDASLAPRVARLLGNRSWFAGALGNSFPAAATMGEYDMFPVPGEGAVLPGHQIRYDAFREAIGSASLTEKQQRDLNRSLNGAFRYTVPAAQKAYQLTQKN